MSSNPKIIVVKTREIIYTLLLLFLVALLIVCMILMFTRKTGSGENTSPKASLETQQQTGQESNPESGSARNARYTAGIYTMPVTLGDSAVDVEVAVDADHINSIRLVNLSESTAAAYPLVTSSLEHITAQILKTQSLENITCPQENRYTSALLLTAISDALECARAAN